MSDYHNENDSFAAQWLRNVIAAGYIPAGEVDERSIVDVRSDDLRGFAKCHFFAGIGGWPYALQLAGWPDDKAVWTGSCPCQPFSAAGQRKGEADSRHLWPEFRRLIAECNPPIVLGEQVASKLGREWLARVRSDLEALGYAVGAADLGAASVGAPHIRQRLWWVADADKQRHDRCRARGAGRNESADSCTDSRVADTDGRITGNGDIQPGGQHGQQPQDGGVGRLSDTMRPGWTEGRTGAGIGSSAWSGGTLIPCADAKARRVGPGLFPLAHGVSARVGRLRGYGNAIVPQVAAEFISAVMECHP